MTEVRAKFWALAAAWGCAKALVLMGLLQYGHALDERIPTFGYGPCLLFIVAAWAVRQDFLDWLLGLLVRWTVDFDEALEEDL